MACEVTGERATRSEACELDRTMIPHCCVVEGLGWEETNYTLTVFCGLKKNGFRQNLLLGVPNEILESYRR